MAYALTAALYLGAANTGLTLTPALFNADGTAAVGLTTDQVIEVAVGSGSYQWEGMVPDGHRGYIRFDSGATYKTHVSIDPAETEGGDVDEAAIAAEVWSYPTRTLTMTAAQVVDVLSGSAVTFYRGVTNTLTFTGLGDLTGWDKLYFTGKRHKEQPDPDAFVQIVAIASPASTSLLHLMGEVGTAADGSLAVDDVPTGSITIQLEATASDDLSVLEEGNYDVKLIKGTTVTMLTEGEFNVLGDTGWVIS